MAILVALHLVLPIIGSSCAALGFNRRSPVCTFYYHFHVWRNGIARSRRRLLLVTILELARYPNENLLRQFRNHMHTKFGFLFRYLYACLLCSLKMHVISSSFKAFNTRRIFISSSYLKESYQFGVFSSPPGSGPSERLLRRAASAMSGWQGRNRAFCSPPSLCPQLLHSLHL